jgi:hypothetical protein
MYQMKSQIKSILKQLAELESLPTETLKSRWRELYQSAPPRFNRQFLIKRLAHRIQEVAYGGLDEPSQNRMDRLLDDEGYDALGLKSRPKKKRPGDALLPGTLLVREWNGERHEVIVGGDGFFAYRGQPYRSLSAVARAITGTQWNGPAFFGMRGKGAAAKEAADGGRQR